MNIIFFFITLYLLFFVDIMDILTRPNLFLFNLPHFDSHLFISFSSLTLMLLLLIQFFGFFFFFLLNLSVRWRLFIAKWHQGFNSSNVFFQFLYCLSGCGKSSQWHNVQILKIPQVSLKFTLLFTACVIHQL